MHVYYILPCSFASLWWWGGAWHPQNMGANWMSQMLPNRYEFPHGPGVWDQDTHGMWRSSPISSSLLFSLGHPSSRVTDEHITLWMTVSLNVWILRQKKKRTECLNLCVCVCVCVDRVCFFASGCMLESKDIDIFSFVSIVCFVNRSPISITKIPYNNPFWSCWREHLPYAEMCAQDDRMCTTL